MHALCNSLKTSTVGSFAKLIPGNLHLSFSPRFERNLKPRWAAWGMIVAAQLSAMAGRAGSRSSEKLMDDPALVEALRAGDPQAPRLLIEQYQGIVFGLCYRMMNHRQDAEDVVQETFVRALRVSVALTPHGRFARGCWRSPQTAAGRRWFAGDAGRRWRGAEPAEELADPRAGLGDPDDLAGEIERALNILRPDYRLVFVLFHEQNLSYEEIARAVTRPVGTVKTWLHRARAELAEYLSRRGVEC